MCILIEFIAVVSSMPYSGYLDALSVQDEKCNQF